MTTTEFDLCGQLPGHGITLLEASAGTGKTYTIAGLVARYIADGVPVDSLLVITFTKAATSELRDRVRQRLVSSLRSLNLALTQPGYRATDDLNALLIRADEQVLRLRRDRIAKALSASDSATITTTHGFCETALAELGLAGDGELNPEFITDSADIATEVATDLYAREFAKADAASRTALSVDAAHELVTRVNNDWDAVIEPVDDASDAAMIRADFARCARAEISRRKRLAGVMTFNDQIDRLRTAVTNPVRGHHAVAALRDRYAVVLVDEFQDTDLSQWTILKEAFGDGSTTLLLIGDPKQAIYAFRGADVYAYLAASAEANGHATLGTNYRSDPGVLTGLDEIFRGSALGDDQIVYRAVRPRPGVVGHGPDRPVRLRVVNEGAPVSYNQTSGQVSAESAREFIANDVAADIVTKLNQGDYQPQAFAVLTNSHREAAAVQKALLDREVPVVIRANDSIFATSAADAFLRLFQACETPSSSRLVRRFALSDLGGWTAHKLALANQPDSPEAAELADLHTLITAWSDRVPHGVAGVYAAIKHETGLITRLLAQPGGERKLTDLDQVAELANAHSNQHHANAASMATWTAARIDQALQVEEDSRVRRLDTDARAVQVITIHAAKGLEFDVVYCPFLWTKGQGGGGGKQPETYTFHSGGRRVIYVGGSSGADHALAKRNCEAELAGETLRKAYVAMTRAKHELVLWWADTTVGRSSPLGRLLWQDENGQLPSRRANSDLPDKFGRARGVAVESANQPASTQSWRPVIEQISADLAVAMLSRTTDQLWQRTSFTALTRAAHEAHVANSMRTYETDVPVTTDEVPVEVDPDALEGEASDDAQGSASRQLILGEEPADNLDYLRELISPMAGCPAGANFGSFVHAVLERIDFAAPQLADEVDRGIADVARWWSTDVGDLQQLSTALQAALQTPLGADVANISLADLPRRDRIDEMGFEFALAGGEHPVGTFGVPDLGVVLDKYLDQNDPLRPYLAQLSDAELAAQAHGFLSGSIDLVLRAPGADGVPRFSIVDYKTNRIGEGEVTAWNYRTEAVAQAVFAANYPVQFLLYLVALHRYLRWRLPDYDPAVHLGPVKYLFVRGMLGTDTPVINGHPIGVFTWQPSAELVIALSDLLAGGISR